MTHPLALALFCCSGGDTVGLERAGFRVVGIDHKPSQHWCGAGEVHEADLSTADAVEAVIRAFRPDFVSSSPPCQRFSSATPTKNRADHPDLIASTREGILRSGVPGWIENVATDAVPFTGFWVMLCGTHLDLWKLRRHRRFELIGWRTQQLWHDDALCYYGPDSDGVRRNVFSIHNGSMGTNQRKVNRRLVTTIQGHGAGGETYARMRRQVVTLNDGNTLPEGDRHEGRGAAHLAKNSPGPECIRWREAMGWIDGPKDRYSLAQAIPPAYAEWLGRAFLAARPSAAV